MKGFWRELSDPARRALIGGGVGTLAGAGIGAIKNKEDRKAGALKGAIGGGLLGSLAGGLHGRFKPSAPGPTTVHAQALDNISPDWISQAGTHLSDQKLREEAISRISSTAKRAKPAFEYNGHKFQRTGRHWLAEMDMSHVDVSGRKAPISVHGTWSPGMTEKDVIVASSRAVHGVPLGHTKKAGITMDIRTFRSFVKTAMELQADQDTPGDYTMVRAAVEAKFGILKEAVSDEWVIKKTRSGAANASDDRLRGFVDRRNQASSNAPNLSHKMKNDHAAMAAEHVLQSRGSSPKLPVPKTTGLNIKHVGAGLGAAGLMAGAALLHNRKEKKAGLDHLELAGLGTLAIPAAAGLAGHHVSDKTKDVAEVAGLGMLAAPYVHNLAAKRSARYAASGVGQRLAKAFAH